MSMRKVKGVCVCSTHVRTYLGGKRRSCFCARKKEKKKFCTKIIFSQIVRIYFLKKTGFKMQNEMNCKIHFSWKNILA